MRANLRPAVLGALCAALLAEPVLAQNTGAVRRGAAGDGNMELSEGIQRQDAKTQETLDWDRERAPRVPPDTGEPEHGGVGTDMEHRQRYDPRNDDQD